MYPWHSLATSPLAADKETIIANADFTTTSAIARRSEQIVYYLLPSLPSFYPSLPPTLCLSLHPSITLDSKKTFSHSYHVLLLVPETFLYLVHTSLLAVYIIWS